MVGVSSTGLSSCVQPQKRYITAVEHYVLKRSGSVFFLRRKYVHSVFTKFGIMASYHCNKNVYKVRTYAPWYIVHTTGLYLGVVQRFVTQSGQHG